MKRILASIGVSASLATGLVAAGAGCSSSLTAATADGGFGGGLAPGAGNDATVGSGPSSGNSSGSTSGGGSEAAVSASSGSGSNGGPPLESGVSIMPGGPNDGGALTDATDMADGDATGTAAPLEAGACNAPIGKAATWNDITTNHPVPAWLSKAKLGIGMHFGVYTVPAYHNEWFIQHEYCNSAFAAFTKQNFPATSPLSGGPWGYKDFISLFTVSQWSQPAAAGAATSAASWAALFKKTGAAWVQMTAQHHDRFAMWDSAEPTGVGGAGKWNAMKMGPKRDVVGELAAAVKAQGLKFGVSNHIMYGYSFVYCPASTPPSTPASVSDLYDPRYADFYGPPNPGCGVNAAAAPCPSGQPVQSFLDDWLYRSNELADKYQLDTEWFDWDGAQDAASLAAKLSFALHYYKGACARGQDVAIIAKGGIFPNNDNSVTGSNVMVTDFQSTVPAAGQQPKGTWMSDVTVSTNGSWGYTTGMTYKSAASITSQLDTINSRGGIMLLNISPMLDGTIPAEQVAILNAIGKHLGAQ
ncbi:MAG: alpha-L-fucosidase [Myxococcota bacterium]|nr:alpha-L-fucosidase [Myxococcota bacterium]